MRRRRPPAVATVPLCAAVAALGLAALVAPASAQRRSEAARDRDEAREWYRTGREALEQGEPDAALASFEQAYALYAHWASMIGMGLAYEALGQVDQARVCFEQGLAEGGGDVPGPERADIEARIAAWARPPPTTVAPPPTTVAPPPTDDEDAGAGAWFWGLLGSSAALAAAAVGTGSYALVLDREYHDPATSWERKEDIRPTGEAVQVTTDVLLGLAGAAAIAAVVVYFLDDDDGGREQGAAGVSVAPAGAGVGLAVAF